MFDSGRSGNITFAPVKNQKQVIFFLKMAPATKFTVEEETFIIQKYHEQQALGISLSDTLVKRAFRKRFGQTWTYSQAKPHHYRRVFDRFLTQGNQFTASLLIANIFHS